MVARRGGDSFRARRPCASEEGTMTGAASDLPDWIDLQAVLTEELACIHGGEISPAA